jgi:hypothetical protein
VESEDFGLKNIPPPRVFSVRVANKGVKVDAARKSGRQRTSGVAVDDQEFNVERGNVQSAERGDAVCAAREDARSRSFATLRMTSMGRERTGKRGMIRRGGGWRGEHGKE